MLDSRTTGKILLLIAIAAIQREASTCGCTETWWKNANPGHEGCTAGPICPGTVSAESGTAYRHHLVHFTKEGDSDTDCHLTAGCLLEDRSEDTFLYEWRLQIWRSENGGYWEDHPEYPYISAVWDTEGYRPDATYRAKVFVNDTSGDGPGGDDDGVYVYSDGVELHAPGVANWTRVSAPPPRKEPDGTLTVQYAYDVTCGPAAEHYLHLDKVRIREFVSYEAAYTDIHTHHFDHDGENCWTNTENDPTRGGPIGSKYTPPFSDSHSPPKGAAQDDSTCVAEQKYQWATGWSKVPSYENENADWQDLGSYTIARKIRYEDGKWWYIIEKAPDSHKVEVTQ